MVKYSMLKYIKEWWELKTRHTTKEHVLTHWATHKEEYIQTLKTILESIPLSDKGVQYIDKMIRDIDDKMNHPSLKVPHTLTPQEYCENVLKAFEGGFFDKNKEIWEIYKSYRMVDTAFNAYFLLGRLTAININKVGLDYKHEYAPEDKNFKTYWRYHHKNTLNAIEQKMITYYTLLSLDLISLDVLKTYDLSLSSLTQEFIAEVADGIEKEHFSGYSHRLTLEQVQNIHKELKGQIKHIQETLKKQNVLVAMIHHIDAFLPTMQEQIYAYAAFQWGLSTQPVADDIFYSYGKTLELMGQPIVWYGNLWVPQSFRIKDVGVPLLQKAQETVKEKMITYADNYSI